MADRGARHSLSRARRGLGLLIVLLGLLLVVAVPAVALASTTSDTTGGGTIAASGDATPAPAASSEPGEPGSTETGSTWVRTAPEPADSLAPLALGAVVLVILVWFIAMSFAEPAEARPKPH